MSSPSGHVRERGFSLVELMVVLGIIAIMAAVALPNVAEYMRNYQIRGAAQQVMGEISAARGRAIMKNVRYGVVFLVVSENTYRVITEDSITPGVTARETLASLLPSTPGPTAQAGPLRTLPGTVVFGTGCTDGSETFTGNDSGFRYNKFGAWCDPATTTPDACPALGAGLSNSIMNSLTGTGAFICLTQTSPRGAVLRRVLRVHPGGRVVMR